FSSRRRHTRSYGDWSSDVCSSDLHGGATDGSAAGRPESVDRPAGAVRQGEPVGDGDHIALDAGHQGAMWTERYGRHLTECANEDAHIGDPLRSDRTSRPTTNRQLIMLVYAGPCT